MSDLDQLDKILMEVDELEEYKREGLVTWKGIFFGLGYSVFLFATALPAFLLYQAHPRYKPLCVAIFVVDAISAVVCIFLSWRSYDRALVRNNAQNPTNTPTP